MRASSVQLWLRHWLRRGLLSTRRMQALAARETWPPERMLAHQAGLLRATLASARRRLPRYAALPPLPANADIHAWLRAHCPVIDKADLLADRAALYPNDGQRRLWWPSGKTSGTSGTPLEVFRSLDAVIWEEAFQRQAWSWAGFRSGQRQAVLRGDALSGAALWRWDRHGRQLFLATRHLSAATAPAMLAALAAARPAMLRAYPSAVLELARLSETVGPRLHVPLVVTGSEPLYPVQREAIERAFGARVFDHYGMAERTAFAAQCEHGYYHLHPEYALVEILDPHGRPAAGFGQLTGTTLHNHVMPLLRYRLADQARWLAGDCPCGRRYPRIELSSGKLEDQLYDGDGVPVSASIITFAFKGLDKICKSQVAQTGPGLWEIRLVPAPGFCAADGAALLENFRRHISARLSVRLCLVADIALQPSGKFKWVAQEWPGAPLPSR